MITDIHSHVLPGIDDGAKDWRMTLDMLDKSYEAGVRTVMATPHHLPWKRPADPDEIRRLCREASDRFREEKKKEMKILPGQELFYYRELGDTLDERKALTLNDTSYVLVEFEESERYTVIREAVRDLQRHGYSVILAHFERYGALRKESCLDELLGMDVLMQSNAEEVRGGIFSQTARWLKNAYRQEMISFIGSDMHNLSSRPPVSAKDRAWFENNIPKPYLEELFSGNAEKLLGTGG